jgi:hypothetical protein
MHFSRKFASAIFLVALSVGPTVGAPRGAVVEQNIQLSARGRSLQMNTDDGDDDGAADTDNTDAVPEDEPADADKGAEPDTADTTDDTTEDKGDKKDEKGDDAVTDDKAEDKGGKNDKNGDDAATDDAAAGKYNIAMETMHQEHIIVGFLADTSRILSFRSRRRCHHRHFFCWNLWTSHCYCCSCLSHDVVRIGNCAKLFPWYMLYVCVSVCRPVMKNNRQK